MIVMCLWEVVNQAAKEEAVRSVLRLVAVFRPVIVFRRLFTAVVS